MVGYNKTIQLINYVDALAVWGLRPHAPPLTMSVDLTGIKFFPEHYKEIKRYCEQEGCSFSEAEEHYKLPTSSYLGSLLCHHWRMPSKVEDACEYHHLSHISEQGSDFQTVIALGNLLATLSAGGLNESCKNRITEVAENILELSPDNFILIMADVYNLESEAEKFLRSL